MNEKTKTAKTLAPIKDNVIIAMSPRTIESEGGILIPESARETSNWGIVTATGADTKDLSQGDKVYVPDHMGTHFTMNGRDFIVIRERKIVAFVPRAELEAA